MNRCRWFFHLRGQVYAYGPVGPMTKTELLEYLREQWGNGQRIPYGTQVWRTR
ncbi:MAG: hypothetical protein KGZ49_04610 [Syntrophaceae bacterium]|nr:hypothetical protein [Syntrophaceae bacterium]